MFNTEFHISRCAETNGRKAIDNNASPIRAQGEIFEGEKRIPVKPVQIFELFANIFPICEFRNSNCYERWRMHTNSQISYEISYFQQIFCNTKNLVTTSLVLGRCKIKIMIIIISLQIFRNNSECFANASNFFANIYRMSEFANRNFPLYASV